MVNQAGEEQSDITTDISVLSMWGQVGMLPILSGVIVIREKHTVAVPLLVNPLRERSANKFPIPLGEHPV